MMDQNLVKKNFRRVRRKWALLEIWLLYRREIDPIAFIPPLKLPP